MGILAKGERAVTTPTAILSPDGHPKAKYNLASAAVAAALRFSESWEAPKNWASFLKARSRKTQGGQLLVLSHHSDLRYLI